MRFRQITLTDSPEPFDVVVAIDVCRAFTTAAYALAGGARRVYLVSSADEAYAFKTQNPAWRLMGESGGQPVNRFDYWNSPTEIRQADLRGVTLVQRTSAGTQGIAMWQKSIYTPALFAASFVVARATAAAVRALNPESVGFVVTGRRLPDDSGEEDIACADYMQALIMGENVSPEPYLRRARQEMDGRPPLPEAVKEQIVVSDIAFCLQANVFDFAMPVQRINGSMVLEGPVSANNR